MGIKSLSNSSGIVNFQKHQSMLAGIELNKFHHLETVRLGSSVASVEFTNLGQYSDYQHLQIRAVARSTRGSSTADFAKITFNSDTTGYARHALYGNGSSVLSFGLTDIAGTPDFPAASSTANAFGAFVVDILDPFETTKNTTMRVFGGSASSPSQIMLESSLWIDTAAVNSMKFESGNSAGFVAGSRFSLYGLKVRA